MLSLLRVKSFPKDLSNCTEPEQSDIMILEESVSLVDDLLELRDRDFHFPGFCLSITLFHVDLLAIAEKAHVDEIARSQIKRLGEGADAQHPVVRREVR